MPILHIESIYWSTDLSIYSFVHLSTCPRYHRYTLDSIVYVHTYIYIYTHTWQVLSWPLAWLLSNPTAVTILRWPSPPGFRQRQQQIGSPAAFRSCAGEGPRGIWWWPWIHNPWALLNQIHRLQLQPVGRPLKQAPRGGEILTSDKYGPTHLEHA